MNQHDTIAIVHRPAPGTDWATYTYRDPITGQTMHRQRTVPAHALAALPTHARHRIAASIARHAQPTPDALRAARLLPRVAAWAIDRRRLP